MLTTWEKGSSKTNVNNMREGVGQIKQMLITREKGSSKTNVNNTREGVI